MALDLSLLSLNTAQTIARLVNYTLNTGMDPNWIAATWVSGSPYAAPVSVNVHAITVPDGQGHAPIYAGAKVINYNRVGFQQAFTGLPLTVRMNPLGTIGEVVAALKAQMGISLDASDLRDNFTDAAQLNGFNQVVLNPGPHSLRYYIDFSPFKLIVTIDSTQLTDLDRLIAMVHVADIAALDAANTGPNTPYPPAISPLDPTT